MFGERLPEDLAISWNAHLTTTAGLTHYRREAAAVAGAPPRFVLSHVTAFWSPAMIRHPLVDAAALDNESTAQVLRDKQSGNTNLMSGGGQQVQRARGAQR